MNNIYNAEDYAKAVSESITTVINRTLGEKSVCSVVLSGGTTPAPIYSRLAQVYSLPWQKIHIFWSDERYVPHADPQSNYYLAHETLFKYIQIPDENIHAIPTDFDDPKDAAKKYEEEIKVFFDRYSKKYSESRIKERSWTRNVQNVYVPSQDDRLFDLVLLGLGEDCHTASLFPEFEQLHERTKPVLPVFNSPKPPPTRITLTFPALNSSKTVYFLVTGKGKAEAVKRVLKSSESFETCPAKEVTPKIPPLWWLDQEAARLIK